MVLYYNLPNVTEARLDIPANHDDHVRFPNPIAKVVEIEDDLRYGLFPIDFFKVI